MRLNKRWISTILIIVSTLLLQACTFEYIPPATKGKILTTSGYNAEILPPGKYTLWGRDELVLLQTNTNTKREPISVVLDDKLTLKADIRFRGRIKSDKKVINPMFNDIIVGADMTVSFDEVYRIYGQPAVRNQSRAILSKYTVEDVHKNYNRISKEIGVAIMGALKHTPLEISDVMLGNIKYPALVTAAVEAAKERDLFIKKQEAQAKIDLVRKENERLLAEAEYQISMTKAKTIRDSNKTIGEGITPELLRLRALDVQKEMAKNKNVVFMPYEAMQSPGAQMRMYGK